MSNKEKITGNLKKAIKKTGKKHYEIADEMGISQSQFSRWVNNPERIDKRFYKKLETSLECSISSLGIVVSEPETFVKRTETVAEKNVDLLPSSKKIMDAYLLALKEGASSAVRHRLLDVFTLNEKERDEKDY